MRYLLDELGAYETDHSFAMLPIQERPDESFMGEGYLSRPVTAQELRTSYTAQKAEINSMFKQLLTTVTHTISSGLAGLSISDAPLPHPLASSGGESGPTSSSAVASPTRQLESSSLPHPTGTAVPQARIPTTNNVDWKTTMKEWYEVDASTGLALKDWPDLWYKGSMSHVNGTKYSQRAVVAREYER